ncbi:MAG: 23S rRNA (guanosine(2251)-2'-O)-methyltransferase RlmB [Xanthomonadales bacterium]|nr:23S rRNA (guanosine(2251)-2'-O)-methyltransferase RlmB [Xanthomonadales bacterium]
MAEDRRHRLLGFHAVSAALSRAPRQVRSLVVAQEAKNPRLAPLLETARTHGVAVQRRPRVELDRLSGGERHQDLIAEFTPDNLFAERDLEKLLAESRTSPLVLILDGVQDPHNLGACLRSAEAAGVDFVVIPKDRAAPLSATARRAAAGAAELLPILIATNLARVLRQLKQAGVWLAGTADAAQQSLYETDLTGPLGLVMGGEGQGMRRLTEETCDYLVRIPMLGSVESLNVSTATAVCLFEIRRQNMARDAAEAVSRS